MNARFFAPLADVVGSIVALPEDDATHLTRVLRLSQGAAVRVFDGCGREWRAEVATASRGEVAVRLIESIPPSAEPRTAIGLALAVLKSDKMDDVIRDAVMLGVKRITPLVTARTEITLNTVAKSQRAARWQRIAVSSAKQCGRAVVPPIDTAVTFEGLIGATAREPRIMLIEPDVHAQPTVALSAVPQSPSLELIVGPEGGWTGPEVEAAARTGCMLVTLAAGTLRADAMPLIAIAALRALWQDI